MLGVIQNYGKGKIMKEVKYKQGMTNVWSDGDKIIVRNDAGIKWVEANVDEIFGVGEWNRIYSVMYMESDLSKDFRATSNAYECVSGYIPLRVNEDLKEELSDNEKKKIALAELRDV